MTIEELIKSITKHQIAYQSPTYQSYINGEMPPFRITESEMNLLKNFSVHLICKDCKYDNFCDKHKHAIIGYYLGVNLELVGDKIIIKETSTPSPQSSSTE